MNTPGHFASFSRRTVMLAAPATLGLVGLQGCNMAPKVYTMNVSRDDGCMCCSSWAEVMEKTGRFKVSLVDVGDALAYKNKMGVPTGLGACHTAVVEGFVIEGHVPADDILKLVEQKPGRVVGLSVPGMPRGSAGMEQPNGVKDAFTVIAWETGGAQSEFATYPGNQAT
ncbi:conserved exported hypothetical protein [uncultured Defluviicoccus sp.]|uniref:DUF411 domain-containing protein n=1 Tax=metagenome TaxID=256318 RepID=A0A380T9G4_9ZZZZ|nr:conserved exported hypothetical protein [uncultured Defluviicoccus sp.]